MLHGLNAQILEDPSSSVVDRPASQIVGRYVTRALADGSVTVGVIFDEMVTMTEQWLSRADEVRPDPPTIDSRIRAALITAMKVGIPLLHDHVSRALGTDMFEARRRATCRFGADRHLFPQAPRRRETFLLPRLGSLPEGISRDAVNSQAPTAAPHGAMREGRPR